MEALAREFPGAKNKRYNNKKGCKKSKRYQTETETTIQERTQFAKKD